MKARAPGLFPLHTGLTLAALLLTMVWGHAKDLLEAATGRDLAAARSLLQTNAAAILATNNPGETALHIAVRQGDAALVDLLLEYKAEVDAVDAAGFTPLLNAAEDGNLPMMQKLAQHGASLRVRTGKDSGAFDLAAGSTNRALLEWLAEKSPALEEKAMALLSACMHGRLANVQWLLRQGIPATVTNGNTTPLLLASAGPGGIARFRQQKPSPNRTVSDEAGPEEDYVQIVSLLLANGAEVNGAHAQGRTPLHAACNFGCLPTAKLLLESGADVRARTDLGKTPLHHAAAFGDERLLEFLLTQAVDIEARDNNQSTPLNDAASTGNLAGIKALLVKGAKVSVRDSFQATPLHWAAMGTNAPVVAAILAAGAEVNAVDAGKRTPLHQAASLGRETNARLLLKHGANPNLLDGSGDTPEYLARRAGFSALAQALR